MSHRVTSQTNMTEKSVVLAAANAQKIGVRDAGDRIEFTSGPLARASLNLKTGEVTGDTDHGHTKDTLGALRQGYSEELYRREALKQGIAIESRNVVTHNGVKGVVRLQISIG